MNCERCSADEVRFRVYSDIINLKVCVFCAITAKETGLTVEAFPRLRTNHQFGVTKESLDIFYSAA